MPAPGIVVVWVLAAELSSPGTAALEEAAREALGSRTEIQIAGAPANGSVADVDPKAGFVRLTWDLREHRAAHVACYLPEMHRWVEEDVSFTAADPERERGRTLGFLIASMIAEAAQPEAPPTPAPSAAARNDGADGPLAPAPSASAPSGDPATVIGAGAEAMGPGTGTGFGAWIGAEHAVLGRALWLGAGARARFGSIAVAQATTRFLAVGADMTWIAFRPSSASWVGVRGGLFISQLAISHLSDDDPVADEQSRWLPGVDLALHAGFELAPAAGVFADAGAELLAGSTGLSVRRRVVAVWPKGAGLLRLGIQTRF